MKTQFTVDFLHAGLFCMLFFFFVFSQNFFQEYHQSVNWFADEIEGSLVEIHWGVS